MSSPLVGLVDQPIPSAGSLSWDVNKIGGLPVWLHKPPAQNTLQCSACGRQLSLLTQLYCPLGSSPFHRCLYVFVCISQGCPHHNQFRIFRCLKIDPSYSKTGNSSSVNVSCSVNDDMWTDDQDDWGDENDEWGLDDDSWNQSENNDSSNMSSFDVGDSNVCHNVIATSPQDALSSSVTSESRPGASRGLISASTPDSSVGVELPMAVSQMTLADKTVHKPHCDSTTELHSSDASQQMPSCAGPHEGDGVVGEDIGPASNRYEELARILNTKFSSEQGNDASTIQVSQRDVTPMFEAYYMYVIEEPKSLEDHKVSKHVAQLIKNYEKTEGKQLETLLSEGAKRKGKGSTESYEKSELKHGDKMFHKFLKRLQTCPEQCIRYDRGGDPLLAMELKGENSCVPPCLHCGSPRMFEFQLLPALIPWLISSENSSSVEFSTVLFFTCQNNCVVRGQEEDLIEEVAVLQEDPDQHLFR